MRFISASRLSRQLTSRIVLTLSPTHLFSPGLRVCEPERVSGMCDSRPPAALSINVYPSFVTAPVARFVLSSCTSINVYKPFVTAPIARLPFVSCTSAINMYKSYGTAPIAHFTFACYTSTINVYPSTSSRPSRFTLAICTSTTLPSQGRPPRA